MSRRKKSEPAAAAPASATTTDPADDIFLHLLSKNYDTTELQEKSIGKLTEKEKTNLIQEIYDILIMQQPENPDRGYSTDDKGAGRLFSKVFQNKFRWNSTAGAWFYYDGKQWKLDHGGMEASIAVKIFSDVLILYAVERGDNDFFKFATRYGNFRARKTLLEDARSENYFTQEQLDKNGNLFNMRNGTLELSTGVFKRHSPDDLLSKCSNVVYDPEAHSDLFEKTLSDIMCGNQNKIDYLQRRSGLSLTTDTSSETCDIWYGPTTRNGKGVLGETLLYMHGDYGLSMPPEVLAQKKNKDSRTASGDIARLCGCRFVIASEPPRRMLLDSALLKTLLGRDTVTARHLYQSEFQFTPVFKLVIATNYLPLIQDDSVFSSGRVNVVTFDRHFEPREQDRKLKDKLKTPEQISAIFNWCYHGLLKYRESECEPPKEIKDSTESYRENSDKINLFFRECMTKGGNCAAGVAYKRYASWCTDNGYGTDSKSSFFDSLRTRKLFSNTATVNGKTIRNAIIGYTISDDDELPAHARSIRGGIGF